MLCASLESLQFTVVSISPPLDQEVEGQETVFNQIRAQQHKRSIGLNNRSQLRVFLALVCEPKGVSTPPNILEEI